MLAPERQKLIADMLNKNKVIKISEISYRFGVSNLTARRDLDVLAEQGIVRRVYGGAILITRQDPVPEDPEAVRQEHCLVEEREAIGKLAAAQVEEGDSIFFGNGNMVLEVAKNLRQMSNLTIISSSLSVINEFANTNNTIYILGGVLDPYEPKIGGRTAYEMMKNFFVDKTFISCDGFSLKHGVTAYHQPGAEMGTLVVENAEMPILIANSPKFGRNALNRVCALSDLSMIITDSGMSEERRAELDSAGVKTLYADLGSGQK